MKNYNPFKMWGSYVIFIVIIVIVILTFINTDVACHGKNFINSFYDQFNLGGPNCDGITFEISQILSVPMLIPALIFAVFLGEKMLLLSLIISLILYTIFGFFIGWGIHSLFRRLKN